MREPGLYFRVNTSGSLALVDTLRAAGVLRFVLSSTAAAYGTPTGVPVTEDLPVAPESPYGESKVLVERMLRWFDECHDLRSVSLRYFNAAGCDPEGEVGEDHDPETHLIPRVLMAAAGALPHVEIFGTDYPTPDGTCLRDYIHVTDLADAHVRALARLQDGGPSATYNLGTGRPSSVKDVIAAVESVTGRRAVVERAPRRPGDPAALFAAAERAHADLGWVPQRALETIVADAWRWHSAHPNGYGDRR
jgi:UDP-glucose-4-epimerase GalE